MRRSTDLDGGGTVAADGRGRVYVAWQARGLDVSPGEANRRPWVAISADDGATFAEEAPALGEPTGACGCCGTRALADSSGGFSFLYRAARGGGDGRDIVLVTSRDGGEHFSGRTLQPWRINACPMSTASLGDGPGGPIAAWETAGEVSFARLAPARDRPTILSPPDGRGDRKHPAVAIGPDGSVLLAWAEGTGWQRGGALAWRVFDPSGRPTDLAGRVERGIPAWGLPTAVARPDGGFTIVH